MADGLLARSDSGQSLKHRAFLVGVCATLGLGLLIAAAVTIAFFAGRGARQEEVSKPRLAARPAPSPPRTGEDVGGDEDTPDSSAKAVSQQEARLAKEPAGRETESTELVDLIEKVEPSVVRINTTGPKGSGTGSGFVVDKRGTVVTNYHVIEDASKAEVVFQDGTTAEVEGCLKIAPAKDLAVLRIDCVADKLHPIPIATTLPRKGEKVATFGSPMGLSRSVSEGIVSAIRKSNETKVLGSDLSVTWVQTTAPVSPGNSGGPLVNMRGEVVGANTLASLWMAQNLNFAVSALDINMVLEGIDESVVSLARLNPNNAEAYYNRGRAHFGAGDLENAIAALSEAIRLDSAYADAYTMRGRAYVENRDYDRAIVDYTEVIQLNPGDADAYFGRGNAYAKNRDFDRAIADLTKAIQLNGGNADVYMWRGSLHANNRDYDRAIADYTEAIRLDPEFVEAYRDRGVAYQRIGSARKAEADFAKARELGWRPE